MSRNLNPVEAVERLRAGNRRFTEGLRSIHSFTTTDRLRALAENGQRPFASVLTCADSRVPAEMLFDQGFGDLFVVRVAGNVCAPSLLASLEFASLQFGTSLILVMGHSNCGAVKAAIDFAGNKKLALTENLRELVSHIEPAVQRIKRQATYDSDSQFLTACTWENVQNTVSYILERSPTLRALASDRKIKIIPSVYDLNSGAVEFCDPAPADLHSIKKHGDFQNSFSAARPN